MTDAIYTTPVRGFVLTIWGDNIATQQRYSYDHTPTFPTVIYSSYIARSGSWSVPSVLNLHYTERAILALADCEKPGGPDLEAAPYRFVAEENSDIPGTPRTRQLLLRSEQPE